MNTFGILIAVLIVMLTFLLYFLLRVETVYTGRLDEYSDPLDDISLEEARKRSFRVLISHGGMRRRNTDTIANMELPAEASKVLIQYAQLTFDSVIFCLDCDEIRVRNQVENNYLEIGQDVSGKVVLVKLNKTDETIFIETGAPQFERLAPTIHHYIVRIYEDEPMDETLGGEQLMFLYESQKHTRDCS